MKPLPFVVAALIATAAAATAQTSSSSSSSSSSNLGGVSSSSSSPADARANPNCRTVELKDGENPPTNNISTSIQAGGGRVSGTTTLPNGSAIRSEGNGSASSSVSSDGDSTVVTDSSGNCTIYRKAEKAK